MGDLKTEFREVSPARKLRSDKGFPYTFLQEKFHARMEPFSRFSPPLHWKTQKRKEFTCHHGSEEVYEGSKLDEIIGLS